MASGESTSDSTVSRTRHVALAAPGPGACTAQRRVGSPEPRHMRGGRVWITAVGPCAAQRDSTSRMAPVRHPGPAPSEITRVMVRPDGSVSTSADTVGVSGTKGRELSLGTRPGLSRSP